VFNTWAKEVWVRQVTNKINLSHRKELMLVTLSRTKELNHKQTKRQGEEDKNDMLSNERQWDIHGRTKIFISANCTNNADTKQTPSQFRCVYVSI